MSERLQSLVSLLDESPEDQFVLFALAKEYEGMGDLDNALKHYEQLRDIAPEYVGLYYHLGALYAEIDQFETALEVYDKGIKIATKINDLHALSELKGAKMNLEIEM